MTVHQLVESGFFSDQILYRVLPGFLVQFGVAGDPRVQARWSGNKIPDDPQLHVPFTQVRGRVGGAKIRTNTHAPDVYMCPIVTRHL